MLYSIIFIYLYTFPTFIDAFIISLSHANSIGVNFPNENSALLSVFTNYSSLFPLNSIYIYQLFIYVLYLPFCIFNYGFR